MRGRDEGSDGFFSYVRLEERIPKDHPLRPIRALADEAPVSGHHHLRVDDQNRYCSVAVTPSE